MSMSLDTKDFQRLLSEIDKKGLDIMEAADKALTETSELIAENLTTAAAPYAGKGRKGYATGRMYGTIIRDKPVWIGNVAEVKAGFRVRDALESIFIMYGTPRIQKDTKVFNAIKGTKTKKQIQERQEEILMEYMSLGGKDGH